MTTMDEIPKRPADVLPMSSEQFMFAVQVGNAAGAYRMPMESPAGFGISLEMEDGITQRFRLNDVPENRFGIALKQHFGNDRLALASFMLRWFALVRILKCDECQTYIRPDSDSGARLIHSSVFDVAATQPLNESWEFDRDTFFTPVAELSAIDPNSPTA